MRKFQKHQSAALNQSAKLKSLMALTILGTVLISAAAVTYLHLVWMVIDSRIDATTHGTWLVMTFIATAVITATIVGCATIMKQHQLGDGGKVIAEDLGGQLLEEPRDADERRLINVVEEMSISSGIPVPPIYLFETSSINGFAAGHDSDDCVLAVTRGAITYLERDELQGVIAHEFSHILNGDMKLNMQLVGWFHGILAIRIVAAELIEAGTTPPKNSGQFGRGGNIAGRLAIAAVGCALYPIGQIGAFLCAMVKAATNRQREFLADAFAVEFTRNPEGLANAMKRMAGHKPGSKIKSPRAIEASHMFFARGEGRLVGKMASHPPLAERIFRLNPEWDGVPLFTSKGELDEYDGVYQGAMSIMTNTRSELKSANATDDPSSNRGERATYVPEFAATMAFVGSVMEGVPEPLVKIAESKGGAALVLFGLWLANAEDQSIVDETFGEVEAERIKRVVGALSSLDTASQLLLFDTVIEHVGENESTELAELRAITAQIIDKAEPGNLFHWMWNIVVPDALDMREPTNPRYGELKTVGPACAIVLSQVCHGGATGAMTQFAFQRGLANMGLDVALQDKESYSWEKFEAALEVVAQLAPAPRRKLALACSSAMATDQEVTSDEAYLIRGICKRLGYEMPCVVPGQPILPGT